MLNLEYPTQSVIIFFWKSLYTLTGVVNHFWEIGKELETHPRSRNYIEECFLGSHRSLNKVQCPVLGALQFVGARADSCRSEESVVLSDVLPQPLSGKSCYGSGWRSQGSSYWSWCSSLPISGNAICGCVDPFYAECCSLLTCKPARQRM